MLAGHSMFMMWLPVSSEGDGATAGKAFTVVFGASAGAGATAGGAKTGGATA